MKGNPAKSITFKQACALLPPEGLKARGQLDRQTHGALAQSGVAGCCFAEVEVDTETGKVRPLHIVSLQDCGFVVNRLQAETQVVGAITQGIAQALLEHRQMDNLTGRSLNPNLEEYKLTHAREFPKVHVEIFDNPTGKVSGIGEPPVIPVAAAIGNAVFNAIGVRIYDAPITPDKVLRALAQRKGAGS
jgi:xanthine dehydrogenase YagR molybdenum-binding subunit